MSKHREDSQANAGHYRVSSYILTVISGIALSLSFPDFSIGAPVWVALVPFLFGISRLSVSAHSLRGALACGALLGLTFFGVTLYWIQVFGYIAWIAISLGLSLWMMVFSVGTWWSLRNFGSAGRMIVIPALWALVEFGRTIGPWGFGWANLGSTVKNIYLAGIASYVGEIGLGFVIVFCNVALFLAINSIVDSRVKCVSDIRNLADTPVRDANRIAGAARTTNNLSTVFSVCAVAAILSIVVLSGFSFGGPTNGNPLFRNSPSRAKPISFVIVQPNIPQSLKMDAANNSQIKEIYRRLTLKAFEERQKPEPGLIIWPESVILSYFDDEKSYFEDMAEIAASNRASFLFGAIKRESDGSIYNSAIYEDAEGNSKSYQKIHLVPFGEYMPMRGIVERLNDMAKLVDDKTPGRHHRVFELKTDAEGDKGDDVDPARFSPIICFESADSALVGRMVRNGARMIFVLTNDGWFGKSAALEQHFRISRMRAIEYGVPVIQAANTGVSGAIDSKGRITARAAPNRRAILRAEASFVGIPAPYSTIGPWLPYLYAGVVLIAFLFRVNSLYGIWGLWARTRSPRN